MGMSDPGDIAHWPQSPEGGMEGEQEDAPAAAEPMEEGEEEAEEDVDSATYEAELEQEIDEAEVQEEVDRLQEESECPIEDLIALYGLPAGSAAASQPSGSSSTPSPPSVPNRRTRLAARRRAQDCDRSAPSPNKRRLDSPGASAEEDRPEPSSGTSLNQEGQAANVGADDDDERLYTRMFARCIYTSSCSSDSGGDSAEDDDENDEDFDPGLPVDEKKMVQVGEAHQAMVPTGLEPYPEHERHKHDLSLVWDPNRLAGDTVERYLYRMYKDDLDRPLEEADLRASVEAMKQRVPDDENLLFLLQRCDYDVKEALHRRSLQNCDEKAFPDYMSLWTEEEVGNFERGILHYGKNFHLIHVHKLCKRDVPQLVQFYYWWKKSARYENFVRAYKLDRRPTSQAGGPGLGASCGGSQGLEACQEEEESGDGALPHLNGAAGMPEESGEFMECLVDEQEFISGNYEDSSAPAPSSPRSVLPSDDAKSPEGEPAFQPWDPHREKFDYELPKRSPAPLPAPSGLPSASSPGGPGPVPSGARPQKSPSAKGSSCRPKRASIMACL